MKMSFEIPKGSRINKQIARDIDAFQSGVANGNAMFLNAVLARAQRQYLVEGARSDRQYKTPPGANLSTSSRDYRDKNGNKRTSKGRLLFVKGKFVSRSGRLSESLMPLSFSEGSAGKYIGKNNSPDITASVTKSEAVIKFTGHSGLVLYLDKAKSGSGRRRIFEKAESAVRGTWKKLVNAGIIDKLRSANVR